MDIGSVKTPKDFGSSAYGVQANSQIQSVISTPTANMDSVAIDKANKKPVDLRVITQMTEGMNKFAETVEANIQFTVHQKTNELMVQVVDQTTNRVLKEFPSHEFLDTIAAIRSYVGILLDKKI